MSHPSHETLWALSQGKVDASAQHHVESCLRCTVALNDVQLAQSLLSSLAPVPPMPAEMARRVGAQLAERADREASRNFTGAWWRSWWGLGLGGPLVVAAIIMLVQTKTVVPVEPTPVLVEKAPLQSGRLPLQASVTRASKSSTTSKAVLSEGSVVHTQNGGRVWLRLPDGSSAGVTGASEMTLATLEAHTLTLDLAYGSVALVVPHRQDRLLTVRAGELEVKDLGTRFLVSRDVTHTAVVVEEGEVEVKSPRGTRTVRAGNVVTWSGGQLIERAWAPTPSPVHTPAPDSVDRLDDEADEDEDGLSGVHLMTTSPQTPAIADEELNTLEAHQPVPADPLRVKQKPPFSLRGVERKLKELGSVITTTTPREARAREVGLVAEGNDCEFALELARAWLAEPPSGRFNEPKWRRGVQQHQVYCLNRLGRTAEAAALEQELLAP
jgi:hypothetical protein